MELMADIRALEELKRPCQVRLVTDSQYVMQGINDWMPNWKKRGWKTAAKQPVKNADLWMQLDEQVNRHQVTWQWVRGHTGHPGNEHADLLANRGVAQARQETACERCEYAQRSAGYRNHRDAGFRWPPHHRDRLCRSHRSSPDGTALPRLFAAGP